MSKPRKGVLTMKDPVIIIGMHRSGTSMLTKTLQQAGLFMGEDRDPNDESLFFLEFNNWILEQVHATWDFPEPYEYANNTIKKYIIEIYKARVKSKAIQKYWGMKKYIQYTKLQAINIPWGWKDPRNSLTLDIWKAIYPNAKIIHIYRNPIDVANSLKQRALEEEHNFINQENFDPRKYQFLARELRYTGSFRIMSIENGYKLWKHYVSKSLLEKQAIHIKYEELLSNPEDQLSLIFQYLDLDISQEKIISFSQAFNKSRKYAFTEDEKLVNFYKTIQNDPMMQDLSYDNIEGIGNNFE